jgi:hypothetical protein
MKNQTIGVEIEMTGITREAAADVIAAYLVGIISHSHDCYDTYKITAPDGRVWKVMSDASIITKQRVCGQFINADKTYSVEFVTPILTYDADIETLQEIVRQLRQAGAVSESYYKCGIHIHIGVKNHTPNTLKICKSTLRVSITARRSTSSFLKPSIAESRKPLKHLQIFGTPVPKRTVICITIQLDIMG